MRKNIATERLKLRPLSLADAHVMARFAGDPAVARNTGSIPLPFLPIAAEGYVQILKARAPLGEDYVYGIEHPDEGLVGVTGLHKRGGAPFELGYWIGRPFWGRGYASEAAHAVVREAAPLGRLQAAHYTDNPASGRVLKKAGFAYTGAVERVFSVARGRSDPARLMLQEARRLAA